jgi:hypothetical protein
MQDRRLLILWNVMLIYLLYRFAFHEEKILKLEDECSFPEHISLSASPYHSLADEIDVNNTLRILRRVEITVSCPWYKQLIFPSNFRSPGMSLRELLCTEDLRHTMDITWPISGMTPQMSGFWQTTKRCMQIIYCNAYCKFVSRTIRILKRSCKSDLVFLRNYLLYLDNWMHIFRSREAASVYTSVRNKGAYSLTSSLFLLYSNMTLYYLKRK